MVFSSAHKLQALTYLILMDLQIQFLMNIIQLIMPPM